MEKFNESEKVNESFAYKQFEKLRSERNVTAYQVSVGTDGKISTAVLSQWKNGEYNLKLEKLLVLAEYFNVPVTFFIE